MQRVVEPERVQRPKVTFPQIKFIGGRPVFNVLVVGTSGSGKTVLLSALEEQLSVFGNSGFRLKSNTLEQRNFLRWPLPTKGSTEFEFTASYPSPLLKMETPLFSFRYVDFPGGYVERPRLEDDFTLDSAIQKSHTVVFLVDGIKLLCKELGESIENLPTLDDELSVLCSYAQDCIDRPIQFLVTKWDVVKPHMTLEKARWHFASNSRFQWIHKQLVDRQSPAHIVPVSSVGDDFATFDIKTNKMKKHPTAAAQPYHLDVSMALAINDAILERLRAKLSKHVLAKRFVLKVLASGRTPAKWFLRMLMTVDDAWVVRTSVLLEKVGDSVGVTSEGALIKVDKQLQKARDHDSARLRRSLRNSNSSLQTFLETSRRPVCNNFKGDNCPARGPSF